MRRFWLAVLFACLFALSGCKQTEYVEVPTIRTEYVTKSDTVNTRDSVFVCNIDTVMVRGDSVFVTKWRIKETLRDVYSVRVDSFVKRDTVSVAVVKERDYSVWDKIRLKAFYPLCVVFLLFVGFVVYKISR